MSFGTYNTHNKTKISYSVKYRLTVSNIHISY